MTDDSQRQAQAKSLLWSFFGGMADPASGSTFQAARELARTLSDVLPPTSRGSEYVIPSHRKALPGFTRPSSSRGKCLSSRSPHDYVSSGRIGERVLDNRHEPMAEPQHEANQPHHVSGRA